MESEPILRRIDEKRLTSAQIEVPRWSAREFEQQVLASNPRVAVFDCDGTLWSGDSGYGFMVWSLEQGLVSRSTSDWIDNRHRAYRAGDVSELQICGEMVQIYAGLREQELRAAAAQYVEEHVRGRVFAELAGLVEELRRRGVELWAVSSTNKWVVAEGVRPFGIPEERVLAAEVKVAAGLITSEIAGCADRRRQGCGPGARGSEAAGRGVRELHPRSGDAGDGCACISGESVAGASGGGRAAWMEIFPSRGYGRHQRDGGRGVGFRRNLAEIAQPGLGCW